MNGKYAAPVDKLLALGQVGNRDEWPNYLELGIGPEHIPDLIRMATDEALNQANSESAEVWAPVHAFRALGQLRSAEAIEPLLELLRRVDELDDDVVSEELPEVYGRIGAPAIPVLAGYLADSQHGLWARVAAATSLDNIGQQHPETRDQVVAALTQALEHFAENGPALNASIISDLVDLHATEAAPVMERAFAADRVDEMVRGDWEDIQIELGLKTERTTPRRPTLLDRFFPSLPELAAGTTPPVPERTRDLTAASAPPLKHTSRDVERKAKAKRKKADKMRKKNRKRK